MTLPAEPIECDAPAYPVVSACKQLGFEHPEDVRWCRVSSLRREAGGWWNLFSRWGKLFGRGEETSRRCPCTCKLPRLETYQFTFRSGTEASYLMSQCDRCHTIFWERI